MELVILGCDGSYPGANGATSGYLLNCGNAGSVLLDCGCGVLPRLMALMDPAKLQAIVITHWHNDHACDLLTLRYYLQINKLKLKVYAPSEPNGLRQLCEGSEFELVDLAQGFSFGDVRVSTLQVNHPLPAYAVKLVQGDKSFVYTGDTSRCDALVSFCEGVDMLLCDATFTAAQWHEKMPHLSAALAGKLGTDAAVKLLLLTHCQPGSDSRTLLDEAKTVFPGSQWAIHGGRYIL